MLFGKYKTKRKIEKLIEKLDYQYNKLVSEAGGVKNLSYGVKLGYHNFGNFVDTSYSIVDLIKNDLQSNKKSLTNHFELLHTLKKYTDTITHVQEVSEYSVEQLKYVKRNINLMLESYKHQN